LLKQMIFGSSISYRLWFDVDSSHTFYIYSLTFS
jgi:hypothetical protein